MNKSIEKVKQTKLERIKRSFANIYNSILVNERECQRSMVYQVVLMAIFYLQIAGILFSSVVGVTNQPSFQVLIDITNYVRIMPPIASFSNNSLIGPVIMLIFIAYDLAFIVSCFILSKKNASRDLNA
jgi:hypothetical protein